MVSLGHNELIPVQTMCQLPCNQGYVVMDKVLLIYRLILDDIKYLDMISIMGINFYIIQSFT